MTILLTQRYVGTRRWISERGTGSALQRLAGSTGGRPSNGKLKLDCAVIFEMRLGGVLEFAREERDDSSCKAFDRRAGAAGRQVHFASLRDAGGAGRGYQRTAAFFGSSGLPQHAAVHKRAGRGSEGGRGYGSDNGARSAGTEIQLAGTGCREFRDDDAAAFRDFGGAGIY